MIMHIIMAIYNYMLKNVNIFLDKRDYFFYTATKAYLKSFELSTEN